MPFKIRPKRSGTAGKKPTAAQLDTGEIALNMADKKLYFKDQGGVIQTLAEPAAPVVPGTDLAAVQAPTRITITSSTGANAVIPVATAANTLAGVMSQAQVQALEKAGVDIAALATALGGVSSELEDYIQDIMGLETKVRELQDALAKLPSSGVPAPAPEITVSMTANAFASTTNRTSLGSANKSFKFSGDATSFGGHIWMDCAASKGSVGAFHLAGNIPQGFTLVQAYCNYVLWQGTGSSNVQDNTYRMANILANNNIELLGPIPTTHPQYGARLRVGVSFSFRK
jgi:hypothetical protein